MTLRLRLVVALAVLVTIGLGVFGAVTYALFARSQYDQLDDQLRSSVGTVAAALREQAGLDPGPPADDGRRPDGDGPPLAVVVGPGTYAELRAADGTVLAAQQVADASTQPDLTGAMTEGEGERFTTVGSQEGSTDWRVLVTRDRTDDEVLVIASPTTEVEAALDRLVLIEALAAAGLLAVLAVGAWIVLRRGLRPLEQMATTASAITAGDLSRRVAPADHRSEVGELGLALNTMLGGIEGAFAERDATEARLRQFLADAAHELRTPLTSVQGFAELFRLGAPGRQPDLDVIMRRIEQESSRMRVLVDDLLLLARLDQTREPQRMPVDLAVLAADACTDAIAAEPARPVTLTAPAPVVVRGDEAHLRQAIANLVTNALRHTPAGAPVEVRAVTVTDDGDGDDGDGDGDDGRAPGALVSVRDHGAGLTPDALAHVFDRFWRADSARAGSGTGLGLSIVAGIAAEHGGIAEAANAPGGGAVFTLRLPPVAR